VDLLREGRVLLPGPDWKSLGSNPARAVVALLFERLPGQESGTTVSGNTIGEWVKQWNRAPACPKRQKTVPPPRKSGPAPVPAKEKHRAEYDEIVTHIHDAQRAGNTLTVHKLLERLHADPLGGPIDPALVSSKRIAHLLYLLRKCGFKYGRICRRLSSGRCKPYVLSWLKSYCGRRVAFDTVPDPDTVHFFCDEAFIWRNDTGNYSWHIPGERNWHKPGGTDRRWGVVQGLFCLWEEVGGPGGPPPRKKKKGKTAPAKQTFEKKCVHFGETMDAWECIAGNKSTNMNGVRFLAWVRKVLEFAKEKWPDRTVVMHMDNASYHKQKPAKTLDFSKATSEEIAVWLIQHADPSFGFECLEDFEDDDGKFHSRSYLQGLAKSCASACPRKVEELAKEFGGRVEFTPPYWPQVQPQELYWSNMKIDYRGWDAVDKVENVGASVRQFADIVKVDDVRGWVRKTEKFCAAVLAKDSTVLDSLTLDTIGSE
jgi:transposase